VSSRRVLLGAALATAIACGGSANTPIGPGPVPDPGPVVNNTPPVVGTFTIQSSRSNTPANFADVSEDIPVRVAVTDAESAAADLKYNWSASVGSFSGTGTNVTWKAPAEASSPTEVTLTVEVVETYTSQGQTRENKVTGSTTLMLHNSIKEVGELARQFLLDFSDSSIPAATVMRNFEPGCYGTAEETTQVEANRENFTIRQSFVGTSLTAVSFGGMCSYRDRPKRSDACALVPVFWQSIAKKDVYNASGDLEVGANRETTASGVDQVAAMYYPSQKRWRLCDSQFFSDNGSLTAAGIRGLVP
jgi:hypothetical protein